ncbi:MAG TPA: hypothetical protein PK765_07620, partial [bacterium]|nr:hypothetical protein [bacterium]
MEAPAAGQEDLPDWLKDWNASQSAATTPETPKETGDTPESVTTPEVPAETAPVEAPAAGQEDLP